MYAIDSRPELWRLGQQLFGYDTSDVNRCENKDEPGPHFIHANIVWSSWEEKFVEKHGQADIILVNQFFDTMDDVYGQTIQQRLGPLLAPGCIIVGYQIGTEEPFNDNDQFFYHNKLSWWGNWQCLGSKDGNLRNGFKMETDLWDTVSLMEWGLQPREWKWVRDDAQGVYFAVRRDIW
ncbi:hypothetical protein K461DRAFT_274033 [Myriangium duriaei CBS 260.36]|uniref:Methyltransferase domain-containing protein n=1 Tax=Myriangium duriaei CBS 260.36 TaxID=1168546 RepID=A0A9P4JCW6_9PEZI|nr:hypothetical protein K461DRAFT_274033 [Myriangium duriaei CBS 260.36]